jgi:hypothetical protein
MAKAMPETERTGPGPGDRSGASPVPSGMAKSILSLAFRKKIPNNQPYRLAEKHNAISILIRKEDE